MATAGRYVQALGDLRHDKNPGLELVTARINVMNQRTKILELTPKGWKLVRDLIDVSDRTSKPEL